MAGRGGVIGYTNNNIAALLHGGYSSCLYDAMGWPTLQFGSDGDL
jgi:hypothetical protein